MKVPILVSVFGLPLLTASIWAQAQPDSKPDPPPAGEGEVSTQRDASSSSQPPTPTPSYRDFHRELGRNLTAGLFSKRNLVPLLVGATGTLVAAPFDQEVSESWRGQVESFGRAGHWVGGIATASFVGGVMWAGRSGDRPRLRAYGYSLGQAYAMSFVLVQGLKLASHRLRPDGSAHSSFPSGHTSDTFAVATVTQHYYGKKWGVPLYGLAALVGASRIEKGRHWPSDVLAGATIGYLAGRVALGGERFRGGPLQGWRVSLAPVTGPELWGATVRLFE